MSESDSAENTRLLVDPALGSNQYAVCDASQRVKYRRPKSDLAMVREALAAPGYFIIGPSAVIAEIADRIDWQCAYTLVLHPGWGALGHPDAPIRESGKQPTHGR